MSRALTKSEFARIKSELRTSGNIEGTARKFKRAWATIEKVGRYDTLEDYLHTKPTVAATPEGPPEPAIVRDLRKQQAIVNEQFDNVINTLLQLTKQ